MEAKIITRAVIIGVTALLFFGLGFLLAVNGYAEDGSRVIYPKETKLKFQGVNIEGEFKNPGEFYFQHRQEEKFDSLVKRRKNFHREMLRDVVLTQ